VQRRGRPVRRVARLDQIWAAALSQPPMVRFLRVVRAQRGVAPLLQAASCKRRHLCSGSEAHRQPACWPCQHLKLAHCPLPIPGTGMEPLQGSSFKQVERQLMETRHKPWLVRLLRATSCQKGIGKRLRTCKAMASTSRHETKKLGSGQGSKTKPGTSLGR
jgi:hypothetical protein